MSDGRWILTADAAPTATEVGGKAAALARLADRGFPVPPWFAITAAAFEASAPDSLHQALADSDAADDHQLDELLAELQPSEAVARQIAEAVGRLTGDGGRLAVRSSAIAEDGDEHSFAGQLESHLNVEAADVAGRVADVWRSAFAPRVRAYCREHALPWPPPPPAVLVQKMVDADAAGVAFSADAVTGRRSVAIVSAVPGLGTKLVDGESDGDTFHVARDGVILDRRTAAANVSPAVTDEQAREIAALARRAADVFVVPQDIEWAIADGELHLLQSRPITTLADLPDPDGARQIWDNANIAESYSGITTPLTFSFARRAYEEVYRQFCLILGVSASVVADRADVFRNMLGLIRGRVYYNLLNWYRVLALLPGFAANRRFMEQMMGVREGLPASIADELNATTAGQRMRDRLRIAGSALSLVGNHLTIQRKIARFYQRLNDALRPPDPPLAQMRLDELAAAYRELERRLLTRWDAPLINDFFAMIFFGTLGRLTRRWCDDADGTLHNNLLCGEGDMISTEPARRINEMAAIIRDHQPLVATLCEADASDAVRAVRQHAGLAAAFDAYLDRFGDRCLEELKLESPTLVDDPLPLLRAIGQTARRPASSPGPSDASASHEIRHDAEQRVAAALRGRPLRGLLFRWVLRHARNRVRDRENLRFERTRLFGRVRRIFVEIGRRLAAERRLGDARDVFYLEVEEVLGFIEGATTCDDLRALAAVRRRRFADYHDMPAPADRFATLGAVHLANHFTAAAPASAPQAGDDDGRTLTGTPCCGGIVEGRVRIIRDPRHAHIEQGDILVALRTDPGWIMLFPAAAAVLVERGSLLSHSAIVARELGIPAIVSVPNLTATLRDGERVRIDGSIGVIHRLDPALTDLPAESTLS